jgi:hypothetical protein
MQKEKDSQRMRGYADIHNLIQRARLRGGSRWCSGGLRSMLEKRECPMELAVFALSAAVLA